MTHLLNTLSRATARATAAQFVAEAMTGKPPHNPTAALHDLKQSHPDERTLASLVEALEPTTAANRGAPWHARAALRDVLDPAFIALSRAYPEPTHRALVRMIPAKDFKSQRIVLGLDGFRLSEVLSNAEIPKITASEVETTTATLRTLAAIFSVSRQDVVNDEALGYLRTVGESLIGAAYRQEAEELFALLEANGNLPDGAPWFDSSNTATGPSEVTALAAGIQKFHEQQYPSGAYVDATPFLLLCPPSWSVMLSDTLVDLALVRPPITVMKSPHITAAYLIADPARNPCVGLLGMGETPVLSTGKPPLKSDAALQLKIEHSFRSVALSRYGIVRIEKT